MELIADILLAAGAIGAGVYCFVLGRRLNRFNDLEKGVGGAVAVLSAQVDDLTRTLTAAQQTASISAQTLTDLTTRSEGISKRLELQMASLHDLPEPSAAPPEMPPTSTAVAKPKAAPEQAEASTPMFARRVHADVAASGDAA